MRLDPLLAQPGRHPLCDEFRTIIAFNIHRSATLRKQPLQHLDDILGCNRSSIVDGQPLTGVFIQKREALQPPSIRGLVMDEIIAPDMLGIRRPRWSGRARPQWASFPFFLDDL